MKLFTTEHKRKQMSNEDINAFYKCLKVVDDSNIPGKKPLKLERLVESLGYRSVFGSAMTSSEVREEVKREHFINCYGGIAWNEMVCAIRCGRKIIIDPDNIPKWFIDELARDVIKNNRLAAEAIGYFHTRIWHLHYLEDKKTLIFFSSNELKCCRK